MSSIDNKTLAYYYGFNEKPMEIRKKCETNYYIKKVSNTIFDVGAYGTIAEVCLKSDCKYIVKMIPLSHEQIYKTFLREALIAPMMAKEGVGPKIYDIFVCLNAGYIIMEKWDSSIRNIIETNKFTEDHLEDITKLIIKMHKKGIIHNDLHTGNILYKIDDAGNYKFSITDYGLSLYFENKNDIVPSEFVHVNGPNIFYPAFDYYRFNNALESRSNIIFVTFFLKRGYISLIDNLLVSKFYLKSKNDTTIFSEFLKSLKLDKNKIEQMNKYNKSSDFLKNSSEFEESIKLKTNKLKTNKLKTNKLKTNKHKSNKSNIKKELFNKSEASSYEMSVNKNQNQNDFTKSSLDPNISISKKSKAYSKKEIQRNSLTLVNK